MTTTIQSARDITREQVENFFFQEADLLDEWRLDEWLELFTDDGGYYIPSTDTPKAEPHDTLYLVADDNDRLRSRVSQLLGRTAWAENPRSRTRRLVNNVQIREAEGDRLTVTANFAVYRLRHELMDTYVGKYTYTLALVDGALRIQNRKAVLDLESLRPHGKVSIII
jgi:p-cumate 2,3-dioxygenase beta subunit